MRHFNGKVLIIFLYIALLINLIFAGESAVYWISYEFINHRVTPGNRGDLIVYFMALVSLLASLAAIPAIFEKRRWAYGSLVFGFMYWAIYFHAMSSATINEYPKQIWDVGLWGTLSLPLIFHILAFYTLKKIDHFGK